MKKNTKTQFVSCMYTYDEKSIDTWGLFTIPVLLYVSNEYVDIISTKLENRTNIEIRATPSVKTQSWYKSNVKLPSIRHEEKDTLDYIWHTHMKVVCLQDAIENNNGSYLYWAYLDFHVPSELFRKPYTLQEIQNTFMNSHIFIQHETRLYIPGCWSKVDTACRAVDFANQVHWRFCGSFLFGSKKAIQMIYDLYETHFVSFLESHEHILTWEVNFWAWLENEVESWKPFWYAANHNDSLVCIPDIFAYNILKEIGASTKLYEYPNFSPFHPMSASYIEYKGMPIINTRFVNYWIYEKGSYYYPEDEGVIRTLNIYSPISSENEPLQYVPMSDDIEVVPRPGSFSEGIEDIRLYVSSETGELCFIGSTLGYSHTDKIRMVRGIYDIEKHTCRNYEHIDSPCNAWCEKNWAPIPLPDGRDGFIYKWYPLEIGIIDKVSPICEKSDNNGISSSSSSSSKKIGRLSIVVQKQMDEWFKPIKGSTNFVPYGENGLIGLVHFSYETTPRQYYHQLIVLHRETFEWMNCSTVFCFVKPSIEFCIGFRILDYEHEKKVGFWISRMDRDPMYMEIELDKVLPSTDVN